MSNLYCVICGTYRKFEKPKTSYLLEKRLAISLVCSKNENKKLFKEEESLEILKIIGLIQDIWLLSKYGRKEHKSRI